MDYDVFVIVCYRKRCYFVDLFVRVSNKVAVEMYNKLGYAVYRRVIEYYSGEVDEDAFGEHFLYICLFSAVCPQCDLDL